MLTNLTFTVKPSMLACTVFHDPNKTVKLEANINYIII